MQKLFASTFGALLALAWPLGVIHAGLHHGGGRTVLAIFAPPFGMYYGIESFFCQEASAAAIILPGQHDLNGLSDSLQEVINLSNLKHPTLSDRNRLRDAASEGLMHAEAFLKKVKFKKSEANFVREISVHCIEGLRNIRDGADSNNLDEMSRGAHLVNLYLDWLQKQPRM